MNDSIDHSASRYEVNNKLETIFWNSIDETTNIYIDWEFFQVHLRDKIEGLKN